MLSHDLHQIIYYSLQLPAWK